MCGPYYPHSVRGVYQVKIIHNGEELLKKQFLSSISRLGFGPKGQNPTSKKMSERIVFLSRFHRTDCPKLTTVIKKAERIVPPIVTNN